VNSAATFLPKFFVVCSSILLLTGIAQYLVRPRAPKETLAAKIINRSSITALFSVALGVCGLLIGLGIVKMPHFR
jgi:hypothetical protein